jgi:ABC-type antimicrobial peptide transport system permease subunit
MADVVASTIATQRFTTRLLSVLAVLALVLAAIGIYGVIAYGVTQRRLEFGIRMALGAGAGGIVSLVMREGLRVTVVGIALGVAGTFALGKVLRSLLADINAIDAGTMAGVSLILLAVALVALALPVHRAVSVQPTEALRNGS